MAIEFPNRSPLLLGGDMDVQGIAGHHGLAELGVVHGDEINQHAFGLGAQGGDHQHRGGLGHGFDDQDAGHDFPSREMALKMRLVDRDAFNSGGAFTRDDVDNAVDHKEWIAMGNHRHDTLDIDIEAGRFQGFHFRHHLLSLR